MTEKRQNYDIFDLAKFVLGLFVVAIHCNLEPDRLFPWLRIAVPLFFIISSFLFFKKVDGMPTVPSIRALVMFAKRNLVLYAVWSAILFPITMYVREYDLTLELFTWRVLREFFMGDGFLASWFIMATVIATVIVYLLCMKLNTYLVLVLTGITNIFCCLVSGYMELLPTVEKIYRVLDPMIGNIRLNFVVALFWVAVGKAFAEGKIKIHPIIAAAGAFISAHLLDFEADYTLKRYEAEFSRDCYFMLIPLCIFLFAILLSLGDIRIKSATFLRRSSIIMYVTHYTFLRCLGMYLEKHEIFFGDDYATFAFCMAVPLTVIISAVIIKLSERFRILRHLY